MKSGDGNLLHYLCELKRLILCEHTPFYIIYITQHHWTPSIRILWNDLTKNLSNLSLDVRYHLLRSLLSGGKVVTLATM